ncbi:MAG TPA: GtrA family protein [Solirubrobacteraceae bacterium]
MREEVSDPPALGLHGRVRHGVRRPGNWLQLLRFSAVGATGYAVNLATFAVCVHVLSLDFRLAATAAFLVAVTNNFLLNRHWTFDARGGHAGFQAARFLAVSLIAFALNLIALQLLVSAAGLAEVPAQAIAIVLATPMNYVGNKLWSFRA